MRDSVCGDLHSSRIPTDKCFKFRFCTPEIPIVLNCMTIITLLFINLDSLRVILPNFDERCVRHITFVLSCGVFFLLYSFICS